MENAQALIGSVLLLIALGILSRLLYVRMVKPLLYAHRLLKPNYRRLNIPCGTGWLIPLCAGIWTIAYSGWRHMNGAPLPEPWLYQLLALWVLGVLGAADDIWGSDECKGLKGHLQAFVKHSRITTGFLKAAGGSAVALLLALSIPSGIGMLLFHTVILALSVNMINLFDLRPGRAMKWFWLLVFLLIPFSGGAFGWFMAAPVLVCVVVLMADDLKGKAMLGDVGSNVLGVAFGYWVCLWAGLTGKVFFLLLFLLVHLYAEFRSITRLIERSAVLKRFDLWGRV